MGPRAALKPSFAAALVAAALVSLAACSPLASIPSPIPSQIPSIQVSSPSAGAGGLCAKVSVESASNALGVPMAVVDDATSDRVCTFRGQRGGEMLDVALRREDAFQDLAAVQRVFADAQSVSINGKDSVWVPAVATLWFSVEGSLYATQIIGNAEAAEARNWAVAITMAAAPNL